MVSAHLLGGFQHFSEVEISHVSGERKRHSHTLNVLSTEHMLNYGERGGRTTAAGKTFSYYRTTRLNSATRQKPSIQLQVHEISRQSAFTPALIAYLKLNVDGWTKTKVDLPGSNCFNQGGWSTLHYTRLHILSKPTFTVLFCYTFKLYWY